MYFVPLLSSEICIIMFSKLFQARSNNFEKRLLASSSLSVRLSVRSHGFSWNFILGDFSKICRKN